MDSIVLVALITGCVSLSNGVLLAMLNRKWKKKDQCNDDILQMKDDIRKLFKVLDRLGAGLNIGLKNDRVIFNAFRKNAINGESEAQEKVMDDYFTQCTLDGFKTGKEE